LRFLRYLLVWIVFAAACLLSLVSTAVFGVVVPGDIAFPLAMGLGSLFAAVTAHWVSNALTPDRARLLLIVGVAEIAAAVVAAGFLALLHYLGAIRGIMAPLIYPLLVSAGIISLCATVATAALRTTETSPERESRIRVRPVSGGCLTVFIVILMTLLVLEILKIPPH
jgi:hypothetical protein